MKQFYNYFFKNAKPRLEKITCEKNEPFQMLRQKPKPDPVHKIKCLSLHLYENSLNILGKSCQPLGEQFYALQNFAPSFIATKVQ